MKSNYLCLLAILCIILVSSCAEPTYLSLNDSLQKNYLINKGTFSVQNLDQKGNPEQRLLTVHYDGFDVKYKINANLVVSFEIINDTNKSLIIDKSKCYVLYNGYSTELFKDVRSTRSTTFNNVQDAINNVQTGDASVTMTIPPYSKWQLPLEESNVRSLKQLPDFINEEGSLSLQSYDNPETVEYVIPYTFDYALAKWDTSRNRFYVGQIETYFSNDFASENPYIAENHYFLGKTVVCANNSNKARIDYVNAENIRRYKVHNRQIRTSCIIWSIITLPMILPPLVLWANAHCDDYHHLPKLYNSDGTSRLIFNKEDIYKSGY